MIRYPGSWQGFLKLSGKEPRCLVTLAASLFVKNDLLSGTRGIGSFTFLWGIHEVIEQEERVKKGWFPQNSKRRKFCPS